MLQHEMQRAAQLGQDAMRRSILAMKYRGRVSVQPRGGQSKSARDAVVLETASRTFILRIQGGNAFRDPVLDGLIGKKIEADGTEHDGVLIMTQWHELD